MKAIGYFENLPISDDKALQDVQIAEPTIRDHDLLVEVQAISVNPIDVKTRLMAPPFDSGPRILGFDAAGTVAKTGKSVKGFSAGDEVYYAGAINRQGSNSQFQAIDSRIVAHKPKSLDFKTAAAMPLTSLTAYEMLFDRLDITKPVHKGRNALLMIAGAGGVGSIAIQLARHLADVEIIATASRPESREWCLKMGAHHVIDHSKPFAPQLQEIGYDKPAFIFSTANSDGYLPQFVDVLYPQGRFGLIDGPKVFDINPLKLKSISVHWESMFTRSMFETDDIARQGEILAHVAELIDTKKITPTLAKVLSPINAHNLREAHRLIETGRSIGKIVLEGF
ncbi:zinc-binding alcohol dehydrogenase family protein [Bartonella sp. LJL80]